MRRKKIAKTEVPAPEPREVCKFCGKDVYAVAGGWYHRHNFAPSCGHVADPVPATAAPSHCADNDPDKDCKCGGQRGKPSCMFPDAPSQPAREWEWFVLATRGDGAFAKLVQETQLHQELHDALCSCGNDWPQCVTEGVQEQVRELDDRDAWTVDYPEYQQGHFALNFEDGSLDIIRLTDVSAFAAQQNAAKDAEIASLGSALDLAKAPEKALDDALTLGERWKVRAEAAECERDSLREAVQQLLCQHKHVSGGNDYHTCNDCGLVWDYRMETAQQAVERKLKAGKDGQQ